MEDEKFDDVTRSLGDASSRRRVVGGLLGGVLGALGLGAAAREDADAAAKKVTVCTGGQTKKVTAKKWRQMQLSGADAYKGKCKTTTTTTTAAPATTKPPKTTKPPHPKKCGKEFDRCNKGDLPCCAHDPYTGARLRCQQGSKKGYNTCVAVGGGTTTTSTTPQGQTTTTSTTPQGQTTTTTTTSTTTTSTTTVRPRCPRTGDASTDTVVCLDAPDRAGGRNFKCCPAAASPCGTTTSGEACCGGGAAGCTGTGFPG